MQGIFKWGFGFNAVIVSMTLSAQPPSDSKILSSIINISESSANPVRNIQIESTQKITLASGEEAYISGVTFNNSARNFWGGYILTRPKLGKSRILPYGGQTNQFVVHPVYYKSKAFDLIEFENSGSGQGAIEGSKVLVALEGWEPKKITEVKVSDESGAVHQCHLANNQEAFINVMEYSGYASVTTIRYNGCENLKQTDYKVKINLVPINL